MTETSTVSVCVVSYNSEDYILETLDSIKQQNYNNIELIISDDGSTDTTVKTCDRWLQQNASCFVRTQLITVNRNTGIPANCNRAVKATTGAWIKLIAADDILLPGCITDNLRFITLYPNIKILFSILHPFKVVNGQKIYLNPIGLAEDFCSHDAKQQFVEIIFGRMAGVTPSAFIDASIYKSIGYYDERFKLAEDYPFWLKCTANGYRFFSMQVPTVLYRRHENNIGVIKEVDGTIYRDRSTIINQYSTKINSTRYGNREFSKFYKNNYFHFINHCSYDENIELLKNVKKTGRISNSFYRLVYNYIYLFKKKQMKSKLIRGIYYRLLPYRND